jgi:hypothetical protein
MKLHEISSTSERDTASEKKRKKTTLFNNRNYDKDVFLTCQQTPDVGHKCNVIFSRPSLESNHDRSSRLQNNCEQEHDRLRVARPFAATTMSLWLLVNGEPARIHVIFAFFVRQPFLLLPM